MRLALLATLFVFAGSIAGFHLTSSAAGTPGPDVRADPPEGGKAAIVRVADDCAVRRLWEEA